MGEQWFFSEQCWQLIKPYLDAINIDLKFGTDYQYQKICHGRYQPVWNNIVQVNNSPVHSEITNLIIPGINDDQKSFLTLVKKIYQLNKFIPVHLSKYFPVEPNLLSVVTSDKQLINFYQQARKIGLPYIYLGNVNNEKYNSTYCPHCLTTIITRIGYRTINYLINNRCPRCLYSINIYCNEQTI